MNQHHASLLVVDDNKVNSDMLSRRLLRQGFNVSVADGGKHALELVESQQFDLVLLDLMMPDINGRDVLDQVRQEYSPSELPVIMVTASQDSKDTTDLLKLGANDYVTKPIDFNVLLARLENQLLRKQEIESHKEIEGELKSRFDEKEDQLQDYIAQYDKRLNEENNLKQPPERRYVTVLFSDLSGYTSMSEQLDPEEVKDITGSILKSASSAITQYGGVVDKFLGDAVLAVFGMKKSYEDDPVRAIKAAMTIHRNVNAMPISKTIESRIGKKLTMHTGISTGVVIISPEGMKEGSETIVGDTVNLASRLASLAEVDEILVGPETFKLSQGQFEFDSLDAVPIKGKAAPVYVYKVKSQKIGSGFTKKLHGKYSKLISRSTQLHDLEKAFKDVDKNKTKTFLISGTAGTGKSRLIGEFKNKLSRKPLLWLQGNSYPYSKDKPYGLFIDLLRGLWGIKEGEDINVVERIIKKKVSDYEGNHDSIPYFQYLFGIQNKESKVISPQFWQTEFVKSIQRIFYALCLSKPTVICFEDIQWADQASLQLIRSFIIEKSLQGILLCSYTTPFQLLDGNDANLKQDLIEEIKLYDLTESEIEAMIMSMLRTNILPKGLVELIQERAGGNPLYVEEFVNSLVTTQLLIHKNDQWQLSKSMDKINLPSTIQGITLARLDDLSHSQKAVLQAAAIIGKSFSYSLLRRICEFKDELDTILEHLENMDFIRIHQTSPEAKYIFKHGLIQEAIYNSLLKSERIALHKLIAEVIEAEPHGRLTEFYEILVNHYRRSGDRHKTLEYLLLSGKKSLNKHALEEADNYYKEAFNYLVEEINISSYAKHYLVDLLVNWAVLYFYQGRFKDLLELFQSHIKIAESLDDDKRLGLYYAWLGKALFYNNLNEDAHQYLDRASQIGEDLNDKNIIGHACSTLLFTSKQRGLLKKAVQYGERSLQVSDRTSTDPVIYTRTLIGLGDVYFYKGQVDKVRSIAENLLSYAEEHPGRGETVSSAYVCYGLADLNSGDFPTAIDSFKISLRVSISPFYSLWPRAWLVYSYLLNNESAIAENLLKELIADCDLYQANNLKTIAEALLGYALCVKGDIERGFEFLQVSREAFCSQSAMVYSMYCDYLIGKACLHIVNEASKHRLSMLNKEISFVFKRLPSLIDDAEKYLNRVVEEATRMDAGGFLGPALLELGNFYYTRNLPDKTRKNIALARDLFIKNDAQKYCQFIDETFAHI